MKPVIIACETIKEELTHAMKLLDSSIPVIWMDARLHASPEKLHRKLQEEIDRLPEQGYDTALLTYGACGNAILNLHAGEVTLVAPRVDDCISLLIGSVGERMAINSAHGTMFMSPGWMRGEDTPWDRYQSWVEQYDQETADDLMDAMYGNYSQVGLMDSGSYNVADYWPRVVKMAKTMGLEASVLPASVNYLKDLLTGPWETERFVVAKPHSTITEFPIYR